MESGRVSRGPGAGRLHSMKKWLYATLGWITWKFARRRASRKLRLGR